MVHILDCLILPKKIQLMEVKLELKKLLHPKSNYNEEGVVEFEEVLGVLPKSYIKFILTYKLGYPTFNISEGELFIKSQKHGLLSFESVYSLPKVLEKMFDYDRIFSLSALHRKHKLIPICSSGSSHFEYFMCLKNENIYFLNPNEDLEKGYSKDELNQNFLISDNFITFINFIILVNGS